MPQPKKEPPTAASVVQAQQDAASDGIDYYELPKALVQRIAKSSIPESSKLQKETVTALQKGSTVFINYLAATAHDIATSRQHKSVSASDVLKALEVIQFGDMVEPLQRELQIFRENVKNPKKSSSSASKSASAGNATATGDSASARPKSSNLAPKSKGKERASEGAHGPSPLSTSVSAADVVGTSGVDDAEMDKEAGDESAEEDGGDGVDEDEDELLDDVDVDDDAGDEGEEAEELVDQMVVDEEEVKQDDKKADLGGVNGTQ